jgi:hypothetical protein
MGTDRELLEAAAKAAGIIVGHDAAAQARFIGNYPQLWFHNDSRDHPMCRKPCTAGNVPWDPLNDDGDALRLAVRLELHVFGSRNGCNVNDDLFVDAVDCGHDPYAATRRAIVRAAAIGAGIGERT